MGKVCLKTGEKFEISENEMILRKKLDIEGKPTVSPIYRFMQLGAFWQHWNLHNGRILCENCYQQKIY